MDSNAWLLLLHQIPPKPAYFRAQVLRRLTRIGALPVKNSAYLLPDNEETREDFQWICQEINQQGGAAWLFQAELIDGWSIDQIHQGFRALVEPAYGQLLADARQLLRDGKQTQSFDARHSKLVRQATELRKTDYFESPRQQELEALMEKIEKKTAQKPAGKTAANWSGRLWVTRKGVQADRIGSAWLIRRFIDPQATFRFVDPEGYRHRSGEIRFDMVGAEFGHKGNACTFEVLQASHGLAKDKALTAIAEMVHDIDLKDAKYQRPATAGLSRMVDGIAAHTTADEIRLERGATIFESLYLSFQ
jgi:hypothetical protein